jgi:hypothetical protein
VIVYIPYFVLKLFSRECLHKCALAGGAVHKRVKCCACTLQQGEGVVSKVQRGITLIYSSAPKYGMYTLVDLHLYPYKVESQIRYIGDVYLLFYVGVFTKKFLYPIFLS